MRFETTIRFKRKGAQPEYREDDEGIMHTIYNDSDIQWGRNFPCRYDFRCIPNFITDKRCGEYIDLESTSEDYKRLLQLIEESIEEDKKEDPDYYDFSDNFLWFVDSSNNTIFALYALLLKAPAYEKWGWIIQIEAHW